MKPELQIKPLLLLVLIWKIIPLKFTPTESSAGGTLPYDASHLSYKPRPDLNNYKASQLESTFVEIISPKKSNIIIGCLYKQTNMDTSDFKNNYLSQIFEIISK